ncbi:MAG: hypothetical protein HC877_23265 [Thioploca sp.]|nr:hypothetical protein [Thioploca sp.]
MLLVDSVIQTPKGNFTKRIAVNGFSITAAMELNKSDTIHIAQLFNTTG